MNPIRVIAKKELDSFFDSLIAYILIVAFLGFSGFFTWMYGNGDVFFRRQADLQAFFSVAYWTLFIFIPALTMRQLAEEKKSGTIELLLTKAVTIRQIVLGKFFACLMLVLIALVLTLPYYYTVSQIGNIDHAATILGYVGLILMSGAYISIGLLASSITNNQIVAFLLALLIGIFFHILVGMMSAGVTGGLSELLNTLSMRRHFESIMRGVVDSKDLIYFGSIIFIGIMLSEVAISNRK